MDSFEAVLRLTLAVVSLLCLRVKRELCLLLSSMALAVNLRLCPSESFSMSLANLSRFKSANSSLLSQLERSRL